MPEQYNINSNHKVYRRGLVLGLTMAEIAILVIFCLLLVLASIINNKLKQEATFNEVLRSKIQEIKVLNEKVEKLSVYPNTKNNFDDLFRELELSKKIKIENDELKQRNCMLEEMIKQQEELFNELEESKIRNKNSTEIVQQLIADSKISDQFQKLLIDWKISPTDPVGLSKFLVQTSDIKQDYVKLKNDAKKNDAIGKGTEMPSCWMDEETHKPEYIFDIALTSKGLIIHNRNLPHRLKEQQQLPIQEIIFDQEIDLNQFLQETRPLFEWSVKNGCRFFVRVFDLTQPNEKAIYKKNLKTIEQHFYKYEETNLEFSLD